LDLDLNVKDVDELLVEKMRRKFKYHNSLHFFSVDKIVILNAMLTFKFWFLIIVWGAQKIQCCMVSNGLIVNITPRLKLINMIVAFIKISIDLD
jgi:hypothetical protein